MTIKEKGMVYINDIPIGDLASIPEYKEINILKKLEDEYCFYYELSPDKKIIEIYYSNKNITCLDKDEFFNFINELKDLHNKMV